jgi:hypothetical protein
VDAEGKVLESVLPDRSTIAAVDEYVQCNRHPLTAFEICPRAARRGIERQARDWGKYYDHSFSWSYYFSINFSKGNPISMVHKIPQDFQYLRSLGINGVFDCCGLTPPHQDKYTGTPVRDNKWLHHLLNFHIFVKAAWNPDLDVDATMDDYLKHYYGPAAEPMRRFWDLMEETTLKFGLDPAFMPEDEELTTPPAIHEWLWNTRYLIPNRRIYDQLEGCLADARHQAASACNQPLKVEYMPYLERVQLLETYLVPVAEIFMGER